MECRSQAQAGAGGAVKPIEAVQVADLVWAWNDDQGILVKRSVKRLFRHKDRPVLQVLCVDQDAVVQTITATTEHPFWTEGKGWVPAQCLEPGDVLKRLDCAPAMCVFRVTDTGSKADVFNFEVADVHNYFVGRPGVLVHNSSSDPKGGSTVASLRATRELMRSVMATLPVPSETGERAAHELPMVQFRPRQVNHTTYWYRHPEQMQPIIELAREFQSSGRDRPFRVWSAASSTGAEAYSVAAALKLAVPKLPFEIIGTDLSADVVSVARKGAYEAVRIDPAGIESLARFGVRPSTHFDRVTQFVPDQLRANTKFMVADLTQNLDAVGRVDVALANNVLIYFDAPGVRSIVQNISNQVVSGGRILVADASYISILRGTLMGDYYPNLTYDRRDFFVVK